MFARTSSPQWVANTVAVVAAILKTKNSRTDIQYHLEAVTKNPN